MFQQGTFFPGRKVLDLVHQRGGDAWKKRRAFHNKVLRRGGLLQPRAQADPADDVRELVLGLRVGSHGTGLQVALPHHFLERIWIVKYDILGG